MTNAQTATQYTATMAERLTNSKNYTLAVAEAMPEEDYDFAPVEGEMSFIKQLLHMADNIRWICSSYLGATVAENEVPNAGSKEAVKIWLAKAFDLAIATVKAFPEAELAAEVKFFAGPKSKMQMINLLNDHQAHHRGQLVVYLRLKGIKPPRYTGW